MTDEERVLEIASRLMAGPLSADLGFGSESKPSDPWPWTAKEAVNGAEALLNEWRSRTAPREQPAQDVSDEMLERCAEVAEWSAYTKLAEELRDIISARAAQREG